MSSFSGLLNNWLDQSSNNNSYGSVNLGEQKTQTLTPISNITNNASNQTEDQSGLSQHLNTVNNTSNNTSDNPAPQTRAESGLSQNQWNKLQEQQKDGNSQQQQQNLTDQQKRQQANMNPRFEFDRYLLSWMRSVNHGFLISSYKTHKVFSIGVVKDPSDGTDKLSLWITHFNRPMGIHAGQECTWISSSGNLWRFENAGEFEDESQTNLGKFDANYIPRMAYFSNDIDAHDICVDKDNRPYYCSALFGCVCTPSDTHSFKVYWKPPWVTKIAPEDRCHLNGICSRDGEPRYITCVSKSNVKGAWREKRIGHGIAYDMKEDKVVCEGLTMPHSPRWAHDKLWILDAGTGYFGYVDFETKTLVKKVFVPGYLRGLSFIGKRYAVVGSSQDRHEQTFQGLPLGDRLKEEGISAKCGMFVINLETFDIIHNLTFYSPADELYDVCAIPNMSRPKLTDVGDEKNMREYRVDYNGYDKEGQP